MNINHAGLPNPGRPSQVQWLGTTFAEADWLKTRGGAMKRLVNAIKELDTEVNGFTWVVLDRPARKPGVNSHEFLPVALLRENQRHLAMFLIDKGIAVFG